MRKTLLAAAFAVAFPAAYAQTQAQPAEPSSRENRLQPASPVPVRTREADLTLFSGSTRVELYGVLDGGYEYYSFGGKSAASRLMTGMSAGNRWGLRGSENLGDGWRAIFVFESRFSLDTGSVQNNDAVYWCGTGQYVPGVASTTGPQCPAANGRPLPLAIPLPPTAAVPVQIGLNTANALLLQSITTVNPTSALFDRQAFLALITPVGAVAAGRQYTPGYEILNRYSSFADQTAGQMGQGFATLKIRANNALGYRAELKGFTLSLQYGFGGSESLRNERANAPTSGDDFYGANFQYTAPDGGWSLGVGYNHDNVVTFNKPTEAQTGLETFNVGGFFTIGPVKLFGQYMKSKNDNPIVTPADLQGILIVGGAPALQSTLTSLQINAYDMDTTRGVVGKTDTNVYHLGFNWQVGPGNLIGAWNNAKDTARSVWQTEDAKANHYAIGYFYPFSRRTTLYGAYAFMDNSGQARMGLNSAGYTNGWTTEPGQSAYAVQMGLRHAF